MNAVYRDLGYFTLVGSGHPTGKNRPATRNSGFSDGLLQHQSSLMLDLTGP
jgi:hypothetical protein